MPELPEVETICSGIKPYLLGKIVERITIREKRLRWPIPSQTLKKQLIGQSILNIDRRAKYILIHFSSGYLIIHLGMSGVLRIVSQDTPLKKHDHFDCCLNSGYILRYNDPRRFGAILWTDSIEQFQLFKHLGPEPLSELFHGEYLYQKASKSTVAIKNFIMNNKIVVGVGNIYASESLFLAKLHPAYPAYKITLSQASQLCIAIQVVLNKAISLGGTTLKDFYQSDGKPGYFKNELKVYGREKKLCLNCKCLIQKVKIGQRMTYFCLNCQPFPP